MLKKYFNKKNFINLVIIFHVLIFYVLEGSLLNPLALLAMFPLFIGYRIINKARRIKSNKKLWEGYMFLIFSIGLSYVYLLPWFFDWDGAQSGSSTAALILLWGPIWSILFGYAGYFIGSFAEDKKLA